MVCPKFPDGRVIKFTELFAVVGSRVLEEMEDFKGEEGMCEFLSIMAAKLPLQEGWPKERLILVPTDGLKLVGLEVEVGVWQKDETLDVVAVPAIVEKAEDDEDDDVGFGTRNA